MKPKTDISIRFWDKVIKTDGCWEWQGYRLSEKHYGYIGLGGRGAGAIGAHRCSWEIHNGSVPEGMHVLHTCDNRGCVNLSHLFLGTNTDNIQDKINKGRAGACGPKKGTVYKTPPGRPANVGAYTLDRLSIEQVHEIRGLLPLMSQQKIADKYKIHQSLVSRIKLGKTCQLL